MVLVHEDAVVVLTSGVTASAGMLPVLAHTSVSHGHLTPELASLLSSCGERGKRGRERQSEIIRKTRPTDFFKVSFEGLPGPQKGD